MYDGPILFLRKSVTAQQSQHFIHFQDQPCDTQHLLDLSTPEILAFISPMHVIHYLQYYF